MKYHIFFFLVLLVSCVGGSERETDSFEGELEQYIEDFEVDIQTLEKYYEIARNESITNYTSSDYPLIASENSQIDIFLNDFIATEEEFERILTQPSFSVFSEILTNHPEIDFADIEKSYIKSSKRNFYIIKGMKYFPNGDVYLKNSFYSAVSGQDALTNEELLDVIQENRLNHQGSMRPLYVDLEIKTDGIDAFNIPFLNGFKLDFTNAHFKDSIYMIPDTLVFYTDAEFSFGKSNYELEFLINGKSFKVKGVISKKEGRIVRKIALDSIIPRSTYTK